MAYGIKVARAKGSAALQHFVETLLHCGEFICLHVALMSDNTSQARKERTIGISSSETGSLEDRSL